MTLFTRPSMAALVAAGVLGTVAFVGVAAAQSPASPAPTAPARAQVLQNLLDCRTVSGETQRLACYDTAAAGLDQAQAKGDVVVVDREQVRQAGRQAFGFNFKMPEVFAPRGEKPEDMDRISAVATRAYTSAGKWVVELEGGAVWKQTDSEPVNRAPKAGSKVEIRKAAMGSYFMNLDGQRAVRARRVNED